MHCCMWRQRVRGLANAAIDPEAGYDEAGDAASVPSDEEDAPMQPAQARKHYVDMGSSRLRKAKLTDSEALADPKYSGVRTSRAEMFGDGEDEEEDE